MNGSKRKNMAVCCAVSIFFLYFLILRFSVPGLIITSAGIGLLFLSALKKGSSAYRGVGDIITDIAGTGLIVIPAVSLFGLGLPFGKPDTAGVFICMGLLLLFPAFGMAMRKNSLPLSVFKYVFLCGSFILLDRLIMEWTAPAVAVLTALAGVFAFFVERLHFNSCSMNDSSSLRHGMMFTYVSVLFTLFIFLEISYPRIAEVFINIIATLPLARFRWISIVLIILLAGASGAVCFTEDMKNPGVRDVKICLAAGADAVLIPVFIKVNSFVSLIPAMLLFILHIYLFFGADKKSELIKNKFSPEEIIFAAGSAGILIVFRAFVEGEIFTGIILAGIFFAVSVLIRSEKLSSGLFVWVLILSALCLGSIFTAVKVSGDRRIYIFEILVFVVFLTGLIALNARNKELERSCFPEKTLALLLSALLFYLPVRALSPHVDITPQGDKLKVEISEGKRSFESFSYYWDDENEDKTEIKKNEDYIFVPAKKGILHVEFTDSTGRTGEKTYFSVSREFTDYTVRGQNKIKHHLPVTEEKKK